LQYIQNQIEIITQHNTDSYLYSLLCKQEFYKFSNFTYNSDESLFSLILLPFMHILMVI